MSAQLQATWFTLFQRALPLCDNVEDAITSADLALDSLGEDAVLAPDAPTPSPAPDISAFFAHDIHNRKAQGVLNRSLRAAKELGASARKELEAALKDSTRGSGTTILEFIDKYRVRLAKLLTATQLASLLEGAREVAADVPTLATFSGAVPPPPSLEPKEAVALVDRLSSTSGDARWQAIYDLPTDQQNYVKQALAAKEAGTPVKPPVFSPPRPSPVEFPEGVHFPTIDEAVKHLSEKNVITREKFDALDAAAKTKSFTVANVDAEETLTKIRDVLAQNVKEGASYETFRTKVMEAVDQGTFMSEPHMETVFRTNVQQAFSDGQMTVLNNPLVRGGFPYAAYDSIHDDRVREEHKDMDTLGIGGTNVFRMDDPVFQTFRPPWSYNCRCSWTPMTVRQASEVGIEEAQKWLETGVEPTEKAFVKMPDFAPPPGFQRALSSAPMSVRLSLQPVTTFLQTQKSVALTISAEDYPRDKSNRFLDKLVIAEAARDDKVLSELRESLEEEQRYKLDRAVGHLRAGGTIHHPKEAAGLAVNIDGRMTSAEWDHYAYKMDRYEGWLKRDEERSNWSADVEKFTKALRQSEPLVLAYRGLAAVAAVESITETRTAIDEALGKYCSYLDELESQFESIGASEQETRAASRIRRMVDMDLTSAVEKYVHLKKTSDDKKQVDDCFNELLGALHSASKRLNVAYEDILECIHKRIDEESNRDPEPEEPEEPVEGEQRSDPILALGPTPSGTEQNEVIFRFAHFRSKYSDTVILNIKTGIKKKRPVTPQVVLPHGTQLVIVGEGREEDGTRSIIAAVSKWGGNVAMSAEDQAAQLDGQTPLEEQEERTTLIAEILFAMFGEAAVDVAKELFAKQDEGISAAMAAGSPPSVKRRYGRRPGPGWTPTGVTSRGIQIWIWGPNNRNRTSSDSGGQKRQPTPLNPTSQTAPTKPTSSGPPAKAPPSLPQPAQPQVAQLRPGGQRARFQSQQTYKLIMKRLSSGQELTHEDKVGLAGRLTNMATPMLRTLHAALNRSTGVRDTPNFAREAHIRMIRSIISPQQQTQRVLPPIPPQTPLPQSVPPAPPQRPLQTPQTATSTENWDEIRRMHRQAAQTQTVPVRTAAPPPPPPPSRVPIAPPPDPRPAQQPVPRPTPVQGATPRQVLPLLDANRPQAQPRQLPSQLAGQLPATSRVSSQVPVHQAKSALRHIFTNDDITVETAHKLFGSIPGTDVKIISANPAYVSFDLRHSMVTTWQRSLYTRQDGTLEVHNDMFFARDEGTGFGITAFSEQVRSSVDLGISVITTLAGRSGTLDRHGRSSGMNGYYTWARFGYDAKLTDGFRRTLPSEFSEAKTVQDLMTTERGREFWKQNGYQTNMTFDCTPESRSFKVLNAYLVSKGKQPITATKEEFTNKVNTRVAARRRLSV